MKITVAHNKVKKTISEWNKEGFYTASNSTEPFPVIVEVSKMPDGTLKAREFGNINNKWDNLADYWCDRYHCTIESIRVVLD